MKVVAELLAALVNDGDGQEVAPMAQRSSHDMFEMHQNSELPLRSVQRWHAAHYYLKCQLCMQA